MARNPLQPGEIGRIRSQQVRPGLWRADASYCDRSGTKRRSRKSGRTEAAARRAVTDEVEERLELNSPTGLVTATSLVGDAVETYLANRMDDARNGIGRANRRSVKIYRSLAENWVTPFLGELRVRNLTPGRLDAYFRNDIPPTRYPDVRKVLHAFVKWLVVQGALRDDPVASLQSYQRRDVQKRSKDREVTTEDLMAVLAAIDAWMTRKRPGPRPTTVYRDLVLLIAGTACRPGPYSMSTPGRTGSTVGRLGWGVGAGWYRVHFAPTDLHRAQSRTEAAGTDLAAGSSTYQRQGSVLCCPPRERKLLCVSLG